MKIDLGKLFKIKRNYPVNPKRRYLCNALDGESYYNICINSDLTVSCNCTDIDGSGHIGDLSESSLEEVFHGEIASRFRRELANGQFPTSICKNCMELREISDESLLDLNIYANKLPVDGIMIENTVNCNLNCNGCHRQQIMGLRKGKRLTLDQVEMIAINLKNCEIKQICYHNLGEPFCSDSIYEEISIVRHYNPEILILCSTNGMLLKSSRSREAAMLMDHIFFSIDGPSTEIVSKYQVGADFNTQYENMKSIVALRDSRNKSTPVIEWKYVVFSWNDRPEMIETAVNLAFDARVDLISFCEGSGPSEWKSTAYTADGYFDSFCSQSVRSKEIYFRKPSSSQIRFLLKQIGVPIWEVQADLIDSGVKSLAEVLLAFIDNDEGSYLQFIAKSYDLLLHRPKKELDVHFMQSNKMTRIEVLRYLLATAEFWKTLPS